MHRPTVNHFQALKRVLRYLKNTVHFGLFLKKHQPFSLSAFADADWGGCIDSARSTT